MAVGWMLFLCAWNAARTGTRCAESDCLHVAIDMRIHILSIKYSGQVSTLS